MSKQALTLQQGNIMTKQLDPIKTTNLIRNSYLRYLKTIYPFQREDLHQAFSHAIEKPNMIVKGPLLESSPPFELGKYPNQLIHTGILTSAFRRLDSVHLPLKRPLYQHQETGICKAIADQKNVIIATGTGSGKTETFLIPILNHLMKEHEAGTLTHGVRALLLYPMNALANDQLKRLRGILAEFPHITFGRYTGETQQKTRKAESSFANQFPNYEILSNERISREQMWVKPPHILLTNYAMLEYLLLRPQDNVFFDHDKYSKHWRFIVLDEAHVYGGAKGMEIAMLLRRLKDRIVDSKKGHLQCIATSATLGGGEDDVPKVAKFAQDLFGETFHAKDVVTATHIDFNQHAMQLKNHQSTWYERLQNETDHAVLYNELQDDKRLHQLQQRLSESPHELHDLATQIFPEPSENEASHALIHLINAAVRAKKSVNDAPLLPIRYHLFARALEGVFASFYGDKSLEELHLTRHELSPKSGRKMFELATCIRCGTTYIVGQKVDDELRQLTYQPNSKKGLRMYLMLTSQTSEVDEDELIAAYQLDKEEVKKKRKKPDKIPHVLCTKCGKIKAGDMAFVKNLCTCHEKNYMEVYSVDLKGKPDLHRCLACGSHSPQKIIYRFLTGQDAPVAVLATALYQSLPPSSDTNMEHLPGQGRKFLSFADSRQAAAFFAPYMERTYRNILRRYLVLQAVQNDPTGRMGLLRLEDMISRLIPQTENIFMFKHDDSVDTQKRTVSTWLMQEFIALDHRISLAGAGLMTFGLVKPRTWKTPAYLRKSPWNMDDEMAWQLTALLLDTLRDYGAVTFLENVNPTEDIFAPRNRHHYFRESGSERKHGVFAWMPTGNYGNKRMDILKKYLQRHAPNMNETECKDSASKILRYMWQDFMKNPMWNSYFPTINLGTKEGVVHQLNHKLWELVLPKMVYQCGRCHNVSYINIGGICPKYRCNGTLHVADMAKLDNHYRYLYQHFQSIPFSAQEHTAQWTKSEGTKIQEAFIMGKLNALSCSTTFELGVDVGELQAVLMRNMPPSTANYVQRAGRAGRRIDSVAFALTFAQRRSHDLSHYKNPKNIVSGKIRPPAISLSNAKLIRRHVHSVLFAWFFRKAKDDHDRQLKNVGQFFLAENDEQSGPDMLKDYAMQHPAEVLTALKRIVPESVQDELGLDDWTWLNHLWEGEHEQTALLDVVCYNVQNDFEELEKLEKEASNARKYILANHFTGMQNTLKGRDLLGFLGNHNILPKYGFPTDVVELRTTFSHVPEAKQVELQRDLKVAIAEFAPGGEVVAAKKTWVSAGIYKRPQKKWITYNYAICRKCHTFYHSKIHSVPNTCQICDESLRSSRTYIKPEFGFLVSHETPKDTGESRPEQLYASRIYFTDYVKKGNPEFKEVEGLIRVEKGYSPHGQLALVNEGIFERGFRVCDWCGYAEPVKQGSRAKKHKRPRDGKDCTGCLKTYNIGHDFLTDVLELRFQGVSVQNHQDYYPPCMSVLYALLEGASEVLDIARDDLGGVLRPQRGKVGYGGMPSLILLDNVPGGAGHVKQIAEYLPEVFAAALRRVDTCECGEETSCYQCLRHFNNQFYHDELKRGLAIDFLRQVIKGENHV